MNSAVLAGVVTILINVVSTDRIFGIQCSSSTTCPDGSKCAEKICVDCTCQPLTCLRSVETCTALQCKSDEDCYLKEDTDASGKSVTVTPVCAKTDPCTDKKCNDNERCTPIFAGDQPPYAKCESTTFVDQCKDIKCPDNYRCILNFSYCYGMPCATQAACADLSPCKDCSFSQMCEMEPGPPKTADGVALFKGVCVTFNMSLPFQ